MMDPSEEDCECPIATGDLAQAVCNDESPEGDLCSRPEGHDGPHTACTADSHPDAVWENDG